MQKAIFILIGFLGAALSLFDSLAQSREPFFTTNLANEVFPKEILVSDNPGFEYFLPGRPETEQAEMAEDLAPPKESNKKLSRDEIIKKFGNPNDSEPVEALETAPRPYQGIQAALNSGDRELAYQYSKKYARYIRDVKENSRRVTGLIGLGYQKEGLIDSKAWPSTPELKLDEDLLKKDLEAESEQRHESEPVIASLPAEAEEYLSKDNQDDQIKTSTSKPELSDTASLASIASTIPVDPKGEVNIYFFFRINDSDALAMAPQIEIVKNLTADDPRVRVTGYSLDTVSPAEIQRFKAKTGVGFDIQLGAPLAEKLQVKQSPTTVLAAQGSGQAVFIEGQKDFAYLDGIRRIIQGEKLK